MPALPNSPKPLFRKLSSRRVFDDKTMSLPFGFGLDIEQFQDQQRPKVLPRVTRSNAVQTIEMSMVQLVLNFGASPSLLEVIDAQTPLDAPSLFEPVASEPIRDEAIEVQAPTAVQHAIPEATPRQSRRERSSGPAESRARAAERAAIRRADKEIKKVRADPSLEKGCYIEFAISLLETSAKDLIKVRKIIEQADPGSEVYQEAKEIDLYTRAWLNGEPSLFMFQDCADLLEEEIKNQSLGQVEVPAIGQRSRELAQFILENPDRARKLLGAYRTMFAPHVTNGYGDDDLYSSIEAEPDNYERTRRPRYA